MFKGGGGGGGGQLEFFVKPVSEIAVEQQTRTRDQPPTSAGGTATPIFGPFLYPKRKRLDIVSCKVYSPIKQVLCNLCPSYRPLRFHQVLCELRLSFQFFLMRTRKC